MSDTQPVDHYLDQLIDHAIQKNVSDIHIEPFDNASRIRIRCDGKLVLYENISREQALRLTSRLKLLAHLDIAEKRVPQDGYLNLSRNEISIRLSSCPSMNDEKIVLRLHYTRARFRQLNELGLGTSQYQALINALNNMQGLILVTGPTGSGKTTTLYAALNYLNSLERHIVSIEDPVEIQLPGITQIAVKPGIGLDFAYLLRAILRQDPDVIMLGEIRDTESARIALQAAQTGHLVLSSLHTNSAIDCIHRLLAMNVERYQLASCLRLVIAQRLIRSLCPHCKRQTSVNPPQNKDCSVYLAVGCKHCHQGYLGRTAIFEHLNLNQQARQQIISNKVPLYNSDWLHHAALNKLRTGETSYSEAAPFIQKNPGNNKSYV